MLTGLQTVYSAMWYANLAKPFFTLKILCDFSNITNIHKHFYDRMTTYRNRFLVNKTNRCTEFQFYWYYGCTCFGQPFCPSSGVLGRTSALEHFMPL